MSKYVHPSMASIDIWLQIDKSRYADYYLKTFVKYYKKDNKQSECENYERFTKELNVISNDLWFFDNEPLQ